jgi:hypothetical protein
MTVTELLTEYVDEIGKTSVLNSPGSVSRLLIRFKRFVDSFGTRDVTSLSPEEITNWLKPLSGSTHRSQLISLFRHGIQRGHMNMNPAYAPSERPSRTAFLVTQKLP